jgi:hypothetical protein
MLCRSSAAAAAAVELLLIMLQITCESAASKLLLLLLQVQLAGFWLVFAVHIRKRHYSRRDVPSIKLLNCSDTTRNPVDAVKPRGLVLPRPHC